MKNLDPHIVKLIAQKANIYENSVKSDIYRMSKNFPSLTKNAIAQLYAQKKGLTVYRKLDEEDRKSLPNIEKEKPITIKQTKKKTIIKLQTILDYSSTDPFKNGHILELNKTYAYGCYTAVFLLARKVIENLIIDILRKKFPENSKINKELYFNISENRFQDFSIILDNLYKKRYDFGPESKAVERLFNLSKRFKKDANDKAHSWFHLVERKSEIDNLNIQGIINLILVLEKNVGTRT